MAEIVLLHIHLAATAHLGAQIRGQGIDARYTHAVQTARNFIGTLIKLATGVQYRQYYFECTFVLLFVHIHGDTAAVVDNRNRVILVDSDFDMCGISGEGFVNGIIHNLVHKMVQTFGGDVAYVHCRAFAHGFKAFEYLDI